MKIWKTKVSNKKMEKAKNQKKKFIVQHKLTGFFSDFPNPKGDK